MPLYNSIGNTDNVSADILKRYCEWIRDRVINRTDAYLQYLPDGCQFSPFTDKERTQKKALTPDDVVKHALGESTIGLYAISQENTSKWICWDFDNHEHDKPTAKRNTLAVGVLYHKLRSLGFRPLIESSDRAGGYHVWLFFRSPVPASVALSFATSSLEGLEARPEYFPTHAGLTPTTLYGKAVRLFGKHARRGTWSLIYSPQQQRLIELAECMAWLPVVFPGDDPSLIPKDCQDTEHIKPVKRVNLSATACKDLTDYASRLPTEDPCTVSAIFNRRYTWEQILEPFGWEYLTVETKGRLWRRPNKHFGPSATTDFEHGKFHVFSSSAEPFEQGGWYSKFQCFALLRFAGDYNSAEAYLINNQGNI